MLRVILLGLALLYRYCPLTSENILSISFITVVVGLIIFDIFFSFVFRNHFVIYTTFVMQKCLFNHCRILFVRNKVYLLTLSTTTTLDQQHTIQSFRYSFHKNKYVWEKLLKTIALEIGTI